MKETTQPKPEHMKLIKPEKTSYIPVVAKAMVTAIVNLSPFTYGTLVLKK